MQIGKFFIIVTLLLTSLYSKNIEQAKYNQALTLSKALNKRGAKLYENREYKRAKELFLKALKNSNKNFKVLYNLGNIAKIEKNYKEAINYYNRALKIDPYNKQILYQLGVTQFIIEDIKSASVSFRQAFLYGGGIDALTNLALTYIYLDEYKKAQDIYENIVDNYRKDNFFDYLSIFQLSFLQHNTIKKRYITEFNSRYKNSKKAQIIAQIYIILTNVQHNEPYKEKLKKLLKTKKVEVAWELKQTINLIDKEPNKKIKKELNSILKSLKDRFTLESSLEW